MNLVLVILLSIFVSQLTFHISHYLKWNTVRSSSFVTLVVAGLCKVMFQEFNLELLAVSFGASFVGMSEPNKLGWSSLLGAAMIYGIFFKFLVPFGQGAAGGLGTAAFFSTALIYSMKNTYSYKRRIKKESPAEVSKMSDEEKKK